MEAKLNDEGAAAAYFVAKRLEDLVRRTFVPDQGLEKYRKPDGKLAPAFFSDTVENARQWWPENQKRFEGPAAIN